MKIVDESARFIELSLREYAYELGEIGRSIREAAAAAVFDASDYLPLEVQAELGLATEWAGPRSFIARRKVSLQRSIFAGDTMVGEARVTRRYTDEQGGRARHLVDLEMTVKNQRGELCCPASITLELPARAAAPD